MTQNKNPLLEILHRIRESQDINIPLSDHDRSRLILLIEDAVSDSDVFVQLIEFTDKFPISGNPELVQVVDHHTLPWESLLQKGMSEARDRDLLLLSFNPAALQTLSDYVAEEIGEPHVAESWLDAFLRMGERSIGDQSTNSQPLDPSPFIEPGQNRIVRFHYLPSAIALAATLLIGVFIGRIIPESNTIVDANSELEMVAVRGGDPRPHLAVTSSFDGFVQLIALTEGRSPRIRPVLGGEYVKLKANNSSPNLEVPRGSQNILVVVTESPAGEILRREFENSSTIFGNDTSTMRDAVQKILVQNGYRKMAFDEVNMK